jgi:hypothetical protein
MLHKELKVIRSFGQDTSPQLLENDFEKYKIVSNHVDFKRGIRKLYLETYTAPPPSFSTTQ